MFKEDKFKETVLFLLSLYPDKSIKGKKKLAKLLYFIDFNFFEAYEKSVTGASYRAWPMGPVPQELDEMLKDLGKSDLDITTRPTGLDNDVVVFKLKKDKGIKQKLLSTQEQKIIQKVFKDYGAMSGKLLETITHSEAPYNAVAPGEHIPYELAFYRNKTNEELVGV
jgi:uncharacterized phage-associated protein